MMKTNKNKGILILTVIFLLLINGCSNGFMNLDESNKAGEIISFAGFDWIILEAQESRALILTRDIVEQRRFHSADTAFTWEHSEIRAYLNNEFLNRFNARDRARIIPTKNKNEDNERFRTVGGADTIDYIFLLSISEVVQYFGDSGQIENRNPFNWGYINDQFDPNRIAHYKGEPSFWWLRTPGATPGVHYIPPYGWDIEIDDYRAADIGAGGWICFIGWDVIRTTGGVRPALWLEL